MIELTNSSTVYVACPANLATGGPELLHQLVYKLNKLNINATMFYYPQNRPTPVHKEYRKYDNDYVIKIIDDRKNVLIVPEVKTELLYKYKNIRKVIWWLSIDNFNKKFSTKTISKRLKKLLRELGVLKIYNFQTPSIVHFVQSEYAQKHLISKGVKKIYYLSDYINEIFINKQLNKYTEKEDIILYNPTKGYAYTKSIINKGNDLQFIPIQNMTREQVADLLGRAKVYIDFGHHPGKERLPRESAISRCCVITGKKGAAFYNKDVPIPSEFKYDDEKENIPAIIKKIKECINYYDIEVKKFENYRDIVASEEKVFEDDLKNIFAVSSLSP